MRVFLYIHVYIRPVLDRICRRQRIVNTSVAQPLHLSSCFSASAGDNVCTNNSHIPIASFIHLLQYRASLCCLLLLSLPVHSLQNIHVRLRLTSAYNKPWSLSSPQPIFIQASFSNSCWYRNRDKTRCNLSNVFFGFEHVGVLETLGFNLPVGGVSASCNSTTHTEKAFRVERTFLILLSF